MTRNLNFIKIGIISIAILAVVFVLFIFLSNFSFSNPEISVSKTFTVGDIPTSYKSYDATCNNPSILEFQLPKGDSTYQVTGIDIYYTMAAIGNGKKSEQRSRLKCLNTNTSESKIYSGSDSSAGNMDYSRTAVNIANGIYQSGTTLKFEMQAWRTVEGIPGCNTAVNRVNASSWTITLHYIPIANNHNEESGHGSKKGFLPPKLSCAERNSINAPSPGLIIWCSNCGQNGELQIYNGSKWNTLTMQPASDSIATEKTTVTITPDSVVTSLPTESGITIIRDLPADTIIGMNGRTGPYGRGEMTLFNLATHSIVSNAEANSSNWDIAFSSTMIRVNNGTSGPGMGGAFVYDGPFEALTDIPKNADFKVDQSASNLAINKSPSKGWFNYNPITNLITPISNRVLVIRTASGKYAKLEILNFYKGGFTPAATANDQSKILNSRYYTFRYVYQPNGNTKF